MLRASLLRFPSIVTFLAASLIGALLAVWMQDSHTVIDYIPKRPEVPHSTLYRHWLHSHNISLDKRPRTSKVPEAEYLTKAVRVFCYVMLDQTGSKFPFGLMRMSTSDLAYIDSVKTVMNTWGKHCTHLAFFSNSKNALPEGMIVNVIKSRSMNSWTAFAEVLVQISELHVNDYDWFLRVDLDTFVILENLRYFVSIYDSALPLYFGHASATAQKVPYNSADGGILLSRGAVHRLYAAFTAQTCRADRGSEAADVELGACLAKIGVLPHDTRDSRGAARFMQHDPESLLMPGSIGWINSFWSKSLFKMQEGPECCSDYAITFHNIPSDMMRVMDFFVYRLKTYGISRKRTSAAKIRR